MVTIKQKLAAKKVTENHCLKDALLESGYSEVTAAKPKNVTESKGFKEAKKPIIKQLELQEELTLKRLLETIDEAKFAELSSHLERVRKQLQLLGGDSTENLNMNITWDE